MVSVKPGTILLTTNTQVYNAVQEAYYKWAMQKAFNVIVSGAHSLEINRSLKKMRFC